MTARKKPPQPTKPRPQRPRKGESDKELAAQVAELKRKRKAVR